MGDFPWKTGWYPNKHNLTTRYTLLLCRDLWPHHYNIKTLTQYLLHNLRWRILPCTGGLTSYSWPCCLSTTSSCWSPWPSFSWDCGPLLEMCCISMLGSGISIQASPWHWWYWGYVNYVGAWDCGAGTLEVASCETLQFKFLRKINVYNVCESVTQGVPCRKARPVFLPSSSWWNKPSLLGYMVSCGAIAVFNGFWRSWWLLW